MNRAENSLLEAAELGEPDFRALFDAVPGLYLVVRPNDPIYTIVAVNQAYAQATLTKPAEIVGRGLFEVFPDNPNDPHASGVREPASIAPPGPGDKDQPHNARRSTTSGGRAAAVFEERYWSPVNSPLLAATARCNSSSIASRMSRNRCG